MAYTWATFKNAVKALLSDVTINDDTAVMAITDYVRARAAKDLAGNNEAFGIHWASYQKQRKDLLGYTVTLTEAALRTRVRELLTDATINDSTATLAVFEFVKSKICDTVDKNPALAAEHFQNWIKLRNRLLGYTIVMNAADLRTAVNKYLTVDSARTGISETGGFIDEMILQARTEIASLTAWINAVIAQGKTDLAGGATQLDRFMVHGVREIQHYIEFYRQNHETVYSPEDVTDDGEASVGQMPEGAMIHDAHYVTVGEPCKRIPIKQYSWQNRFDLVCGAPTMSGHNFFMAIDPNGKTFTLFPPVLEGNYLSVFWDGIKTDFVDGDSVPFDDSIVKAVSDFVLSEQYRRPGPMRDLKAADIHHAAYLNARTQAYRDSRDKKRIRFTEASPLQSSQCAVTTPDDEVVEFVFFGDSGEDPLTDTESVVALAKGLDPDFIFHAGDTNYEGNVESYQDFFYKYFSEWIRNEDFYQAWGNHDLELTDGGQYGKPLLDLLPHIAELSEDKLYYKFTRGNLNFFVYNSGFTDGDPREPDGIADGSTQADWLYAALDESTSGFNIVIMHRPPWCSDTTHTPGSAVLQGLDLAGHGVHLVLAAHGHNYERFLIEGIPHIVCGLGGATKRGFGSVVSGSQFRYNTKNGVLRISGSETRLQVALYNTDREVVDSISIEREA